MLFYDVVKERKITLAFSLSLHLVRERHQRPDSCSQVLWTQSFLLGLLFHNGAILQAKGTLSPSPDIKVGLGIARATSTSIVEEMESHV